MKRKILTAVLSHLTAVLAVMFLVFLVLDQFNPLMNFVNGPLSQGLLALFCVSGIGLAVTVRLDE